MALSGRRVGFIVLLAVVALAGLVILQVSLLRYAMEIKEQTFRNNVMSALGRISEDLATGEAVSVAIQAGQQQLGPQSMRVMAFVTDDNFAHQYSYQHSGDAVTSESSDDLSKAPFSIEDGRVSYQVSSPQRVTLTVQSLADREETTLVDSFLDAGTYELEIDPERYAQGRFMWHFKTDSGLRVLRVMSDGGDTLVNVSQSGKQQLASDVLDRLFAAEFAPVTDRLDSIDVDSVIATTLEEAGISMPYAYGVRSPFSDSLYLAEPVGYEDELRGSDMQVRLFPKDVFASPAYLALHFPERRSYLWAQIMPLVGAEVLFMLIIIACFAYTIRTILRQRRFSRLLVDFINNMTHEFKTPISTVALATEAIGRPDIVEQKEKVLQFNEMIRTEIGRMRSQAEKILQMATLEEGDIQLALSDVDLHELVGEAVGAVSLQAESRGGSITTELAARHPVVHGDRLHLSNIVHNLLDNAMKYSPDGPRIEVSTADGPEGVHVMIRDRGIGMAPEDQKQVFEKYYRVPTGNRHDVKGFGLGLSYVKLMVMAHGGSVALRSTPGEGTTVEFTLPALTRGSLDA